MICHARSSGSVPQPCSKGMSCHRIGRPSLGTVGSRAGQADGYWYIGRRQAGLVVTSLGRHSAADRCLSLERAIREGCGKRC